MARKVVHFYIEGLGSFEVKNVDEDFRLVVDAVAIGGEDRRGEFDILEQVRVL